MTEHQPAASGLWVSDMQELTGEETDRALAMVGIGAEEMRTRAMSLTCAAAVVLAQRTDPSIPDETWRRLKLSDLDVRSELDPADPT